ncbi:hypothetical protein CROQUDRAFT_672156 [Cronartium quercuum f. sp. fusiforme G11]|uniref:RRM domain-containing protein n=1 Tax=Cronartium quercuum f. sp. fusiforme G11 TaxID=708437 RepID=A0A9P6TBP3_9BASI|nr:hypothetical protein CROQUDRAFT_672156 [Cronartium quercuum f. sp. fusiforme G11]
MHDDKANGMGNGHGLSSNKESDRWATDERRRDDDHHRRRSRRSRSRSRSPRRSHRSKSRSRSPRDRHDRHERRSSRSPPRREHGGSVGFSSHGRGPPDDTARRAMNRELAAAEASKRSVKENRVYVGNLAFSVKWSDLKDFMREVGHVVFAEVMVLPNGMSKGCGVVEFSTREEAEKAVKTLNDTPLFGRQVFVREDREEEARYGALAVSGAGFAARGGFGGGGGGRGGYVGGYGGGPPSSQACKQLAISGLPFNVGWQDLKDMFRSAGAIIRADVYFGPDGSPTGNGMVIFETARDAQNAIAMFNGFEYEGRTMEVREDRSAGMGSGSFRGALRGGFRGGMGGRGSFRGGYGGGRDTSNLYGDYSGQDMSTNGGTYGGGPGLRGGYGGGGGRGGFGGGGASGSAFGGPSMNIQPNQQIFVKNLPWSTSNDDLVELFQTTGKVQNAEVLSEAGRSKGVGVIEFETVEEAETAIAKFQGYSYGGRPLSLEFNGRWRDFSIIPGGSTGAGGYGMGH